jgi:hypothetical protein
MRDNTTIDYEQLGLKFRLYSCEILFNRGLSMIYMVRPLPRLRCQYSSSDAQGQSEPGMDDLAKARSEKQTDEHGVIDEAFLDRGDVRSVKLV